MQPSTDTVERHYKELYEEEDTCMQPSTVTVERHYRGLYEEEDTCMQPSGFGGASRVRAGLAVWWCAPTGHNFSALLQKTILVCSYRKQN